MFSNGSNLESAEL